MIKNLKDYNTIFFIGIGGVSMSALAMLLKFQGKKVLGSDMQKNDVVKKLKKSGIKVFSSHNEKHIKNVDMVVFSGAISSKNPEYVAAKKNGIAVVERSELLYLLSKGYKNVIAIAGTHGKTTTTAMLSAILLENGLNPTVHIGGKWERIGGNFYDGDKEYFVTEACEFRDSFLKLKPKYSIITNIEPEHLDYFSTFEKEKQSFKAFCEKTKKICYINSKYKKLLQTASPLCTFGDKVVDNYCVKDVKLCDDGKYAFDCYKDKCFIGNFKLNIYGKHNVFNALAAIAVGTEIGVEPKQIDKALKNFCGVERRFECIGTFGTNTIIHDYAHHPTEISSAISTAMDFAKSKIICIFQPHTYSRTRKLIDNFVECFSNISELFLLKTYPAREPYDYLGSAEYLAKQISNKKQNFKVRGVFEANELLEYLKNGNYENCIFLFLGAGDIENVARKFK